VGNQIRPHERRVQVLKILQEYGSLTATGIAEIIDPPMKLKKLRTCLERLRARKLVYVRVDTRSGRNPPFYQMSGRAELKHTIRSLLKAQNEDLRVPETKFEENIHGQRVALWAHQPPQRGETHSALPWASPLRFAPGRDLRGVRPGPHGPAVELGIALELLVQENRLKGPLANSVSDHGGVAPPPRKGAQNWRGGLLAGALGETRTLKPFGTGS
jgi:hypothetical protein